MTDFLYVSPHRTGKAIEQAKELAALAKKLGGAVEITVRPVAEIDALKQQVATLLKAAKSVWRQHPGPCVCEICRAVNEVET